MSAAPRVVVLGASGFVAGALVRLLEGEGEACRAIGASETDLTSPAAVAQLAAILRPSSRRDLVRVGIASYGLDPAPGRTPDLGLVPAMTARASLALVKHVEAGAAVSYGRTWVADRATTLGLVPAGYGDGLPRLGGNRAEVQVAGARRPVRGRICMDQLVVDLDGEDPGAGADVTVFGPGAEGEPTAQDWAEACGTIGYEVVSRIGGRFARRHVDDIPQTPTRRRTRLHMVVRDGEKGRGRGDDRGRPS